MDASESRRRRPWARLALLLIGVIALAVTVRLTGLTDHLTVEGIRAAVADAGVWGILLFVVAFAAGNVAQIPGFLFISAASVCWGGAEAVAIALIGSVVAVSLSFVIVRAVGGTPLAAPKAAWVRRVMDSLERRPVRTIALLRLVVWVAPPLNAALALSGVSFRQYLIGSTLGLAAPVAALAGGLVAIL